MTAVFKNLNFRKLKISDYEEFRILFFSCFKKKISLEFFKWRYFSDKYSFCYAAFDSSRLIANVGLISTKFNYKSTKINYSRHSSMVQKKYRGIGIFSKLLEKVKRKFFNNTSLIFMWPNKNNFANFGFDKKNMVKKKYYLYKTCSTLNSSQKIKNCSINDLNKYKKFIKNNDSLFIKNFFYFKKRYLSYRNHEYFINKFVHKNLTSFLILKRNKDKSGINYVILDHFGSKKIYSKHLSYLISSLDNLIFLSKKRKNNPHYEFLNSINLKVGFVKKFNIEEKKFFLNNKEVFLGDTDIFITI